MRPTSMMFRNLMAMDVEESIRANPLDGVRAPVRLRQDHAGATDGRGERRAAGDHGHRRADAPRHVAEPASRLRHRCLALLDELRAGRINEEEWCELESCMSRSTGHCMVMGTASTMTSLAEAMGMTLTGCASIPAADSRRNEIAERSGARIVAMVRENLTPDKIITRKSIENAIRVNMAIGGSTNAIIHLKAVAGRLGIDLPLRLYDEISNITPVIANIRPSGEYLMEDLFYAGGVPAVMKQIESMLHPDTITVTGKTTAENIASAKCHNPDVIRSLDNPLQTEGGTVILYGNLCPDGAVIKTSAADPRLMSHTGRAVVFEDHEDFMARYDDPSLEIEETCVMVLKNGGPRADRGCRNTATCRYRRSC